MSAGIPPPERGDTGPQLKCTAAQIAAGQFVGLDADRRVCSGVCWPGDAASQPTTSGGRQQQQLARCRSASGSDAGLHEPAEGPERRGILGERPARPQVAVFCWQRSPRPRRCRPLTSAASAIFGLLLRQEHRFAEHFHATDRDAECRRSVCRRTRSRRCAGPPGAARRPRTISRQDPGAVLALRGQAGAGKADHGLEVMVEADLTASLRRPEADLPLRSEGCSLKSRTRSTMRGSRAPPQDG